MSERENGREIKDKELDFALNDLKERIIYAFSKHGNGIFENSFESIGVITLEFEEFKKAVQEKEGKQSEFNEALDTAAFALVTAISIKKRAYILRHNVER
jgi:hypothetical protein